MNSTGHLVIKPQFDEVGEFHEGRALIGLSTSPDGSLWGYIDSSGKMVVTPQYEEADDFSEGLADVCTGDDLSDPKKPAPVESQADLSNAYAGRQAESQARLVQESFSCGYINRDGNVAIPMQFGMTYSFSEGLAKVCVGKCDLKQGGKFGFIDHSGHFIVSPQYDNVEDFRNDNPNDPMGAPSSARSTVFAKVVIGKGLGAKTGYIDKTGKTVWQPSN